MCAFFIADVCAQDEEKKEEEKKPEEPKKLVSLSLEEYVVVGTRGERKLLSLSDTISVISSPDVEAANAVSVDELLGSIPGINIQGTGEFGDKVTLNLRGLQGRWGAQRVLVLIDGRPANEEYLGDFDFRFVPVEAIERIEVTKGPASALYGGLAIGGVINIVTKDPRKGSGGKLSAALGNHNSRRYTTTFTSVNGPIAGLLTMNIYGTDGYLKNSDGSNRDWESGRLYSKTHYKVGKRSLLTFASGTSYGTAHEEDFKRYDVNDFQYLTLETLLDEGRDRKLDLRMYRNGTFSELAWKFGFDGRYHQYTAGAQAQYTHNFSEFNTLTSGFELKTQRANVGEVAGHIVEQITESSLYAQQEFTLGKLKLTLGARLDNNEEFGSQVSPRLGVTYEPVKDTILRMAGGKAFRPPTISDLYMPPTTFMGMIFEGNPDLDPETLWSGELGLRQKMKIANKDVSLDLAVYRSRGVDFWDYMVVSFVPLTLRPLNVNAVNIFGGEAEISAIIAAGLKLSLGYTYTDARYSRYEPDPSIEHNHVEDIPQHTGSAVLAYRGKTGHTAFVKLSIAGDRFTDPDNTKANKLHSFAVLSVGGTAKLSKHTSAFARINNLADKKYRVVSNQVQPGRTFTVGMSVEF
jgi:outer membrane receptor for ferrienterochelin and colicins